MRKKKRRVSQKDWDTLFHRYISEYFVYISLYIVHSLETDDLLSHPYFYH